MTVGPSALQPSAFVFVDDLHAPAPGESDQHHLVRVLRLRAGELVVASDGAGSWRPCTVTATSADGVVLEPAGDVVTEAAPDPTVTVGFALTKGDRPEWVVQKLTELGVDRILPVAGERSVVRWSGDRGVRHHERLVAVAREAAMQSRRPTLPVVGPVATLAEAVEGCEAFGLCEVGGDSPLTLAAPALFVGPEGGWSAAERALAPRTIDLGPTTLRAETATIAAGVLLCALRSATVRAHEV